MSAEQQVDYSVVLTDMEAKRTALDAAIASMKIFLNGQAAGSVSTGDSAPDFASFPNSEIPTGAFLGKSIPEAATLYLQIMKRKSTIREIAEGLRKGGLESTSSNFQGIVRAVLDRNRKAGGEVVKIDKSLWGLATWIRGGVRAAMVSQEKRAATKKKKRAKRKSEAAANPEKNISVEVKPTTPVAESKSGSPYQRINAFLLAHPLSTHSLEKISGAVGLKPSVAAMHLGNLVKYKKAERTPAGDYGTYTAKTREMPSEG